MGGLFSLLNVGASALFAEQRASTIAGQNIANASTPGYTRQSVVRSSQPPVTFGVQITSTERAQDAMVRRRLEDQLGMSAYSDRRADRLSQLEDVAVDIGDNGLLANMDELFAAFRGLEANPDEPAQRREVVAAADTLASSIRRMAADFESARSGLNNEIVGEIERVNARSADVARLNSAIKVAEAGGESANELRDERDRAVQDLAELAGAYGIEDESGDVSVVVNGIVLAQDDAA
ncbi:MAG: flagellar hook-associated protein FlgK, partial [Myxococcota bacterium]